MPVTSDAFVLSSRFEGMPIAILEAMACGLPVVASDVGGISEVILEGATGFLVPPADTEALAERLGRLVSNADTRRQFGEASYRRAQESFSLPRWQREHLELYRSLRST